MTYQTDPKSSGFRELSPLEIEAISGGNGSLYGDEYLGHIVVTGSSGGGFNFGGLGGIGGIGNLGTTGVVIAPGLIDYDGDGFADEIIVTPNEPGICAGGGADGAVGQVCSDTIGNGSVRIGIGTPGIHIDLEDTRSISNLGVHVNTTNATVNIPMQDVADGLENVADSFFEQLRNNFREFSDGLYYQFNLDGAQIP